MRKKLWPMTREHPVSLRRLREVKILFIVTPCFFIALSLTVLSLVRRFGQKRVLND